MSKGFLVFVLLVVVGLIAYWAFYPGASAATIYLSSQNNSSQTGVVTVRDDASGKAHVVVNLVNEPAGASQPMHFHAGSCAVIGAVKYTLANAVNGKSETTLSVSTSELMAQLPLAVNVHKSAAEMGVYVACGDVVR